MVLLLYYVFFLPGNFVEIVLVSKNAPQASHCGGAENDVIATRRRRRMSQAAFFILINTAICFRAKANSHYG